MVKQVVVSYLMDGFKEMALSKYNERCEPFCYLYTGCWKAWVREDRIVIKHVRQAQWRNGKQIYYSDPDLWDKIDKAAELFDIMEATFIAFRGW